MKELADGTNVTSRGYYFILDWNDRNNFEYLMNTFRKKKLFELNLNEYRNLFVHAFNDELYQLDKKMIGKKCKHKDTGHIGKINGQLKPSDKFPAQWGIYWDDRLCDKK